MLRYILGGLFAVVLALVWLGGATSVHAQPRPPIDGIADTQCQQDAVNQCDAGCGGDGPCELGCQIGGINNADTCATTCLGLGAPCLNACLQTIEAMTVCMLPQVSGVVGGLGDGRSVVLRMNAGYATTISANGPFTLPTYVEVHQPYAVTIVSQPEGQNCLVTNGSGLATRYAVTGVAVSCVTTVPMLSNWRMPLLVGLLAIGGLLLLSPVLARAARPPA